MQYWWHEMHQDSNHEKITHSCGFLLCIKGNTSFKTYSSNLYAAEYDPTDEPIHSKSFQHQRYRYNKAVSSLVLFCALKTLPCPGFRTHKPSNAWRENQYFCTAWPNTSNSISRCNRSLHHLWYSRFIQVSCICQLNYSPRDAKKASSWLISSTLAAPDWVFVMPCLQDEQMFSSGNALYIATVRWSDTGIKFCARAMNGHGNPLRRQSAS